MPVDDLLHERAAEVSRLATTARTNLDKAETLIPVVNEQLSELAPTGVSDLRVEGLAVHSQHQGQADDHSNYCGMTGLPWTSIAS